ncbi:Protein CBG22940 [Caenorhabditis briggsae]|uniref:Uncharacterized protein n=2 Tax=Caenorhabditis briggsae TaxID=6238 RepID=A0AAE9EQF6_CAEBR|nr:Protein CBG22940 [Caenorhabditis briggsae]UMM25924.1 hypothetical protein L5515_005538 [Caenorhabditis briggsae]CAP39488.1 Protein CBG22940 [Caenorhabditis briggsae]
MSENQESEKSKVSNGSSSGGDELEGATGTAVRIKQKRSKKRNRKSSKSGSKSRKDDVPKCETVEKGSTKSANNETAQSEWLDEIVPEASGNKSKKSNFFEFFDSYKFPILFTSSAILAAGILVYFAVKKTSPKVGGAKCPMKI